MNGNIKWLDCLLSNYLIRRWLTILIVLNVTLLWNINFWSVAFSKMFLRQFFLHLNHHLCYSRISNSSFIGEIKMQSSVRYIWKWYPQDYTLNWMRTIYVIIMSSLIYFLINRYILFFILYYASLNPNNIRFTFNENSCAGSKEQKLIPLSFEKFCDLRNENSHCIVE